MNFRRSIRRLCAGASVSLGILALLPVASAQQITYYDFDVPATTPAETSYACPATVTSSSLLLCFNDGTGAAANPSYLSDTFPAIIDPNQQDAPAVSSTHNAVQMTPAAPGNDANLWFAVPQKVASGFTTYFTFKFTPSNSSSATADGLAFVIQNANGGGTSGLCSASGSKAAVIGGQGGQGGCIGYGGIDNSLAIEFDTYVNSWDPTTDGQVNPNDANHVAIQNCGAGLPNSPDHTGTCLVKLNASTNTPLNAITSMLNGVTMADGHVHQVVVVYNGPTEANPNRLQIYLDPPFVSGTHTPDPLLATPVLQGTYDLAANLNLINSADANSAPLLDSAYIGFTSATGQSFEQHEVMNWTYTPHTTTTQTQPIAQGGQPTIFPFGSHVYATTYPANIQTNGISQVVTANTIKPDMFVSLINAGPFAGSQCQVYDDTGGNCIIYSVSCVTTGTNNFVQCPTTEVDNPILIKSAYNDSVAAISPGYLQGDPFYNLIASISGSGGTGTVNCLGECAVTTGQTVTIAGATSSGNPSPFNGTITVAATDPTSTNTFTFATAVSGSATGGYLTSTNVQNVFSSYSPLRLDATTTGKVNHFSDFVVTAVTSAATNLAIQAPAVVDGAPAIVTVTATSANGTPTGNVVLAVDGVSQTPQPLVGGIAIFTLTGLAPGNHSLTATSPASTGFNAGFASSILTINNGPVATVSTTSLDFGTLYVGNAALKSVTLTNTGNVPMAIHEPFIQDVGNGDSKEFISISLCPRTLAVNRSCSIGVLFLAGPSYNPQTAVLQIMDNVPGSPQSVNLTALVINPRAYLSPQSLNFGHILVGNTAQSSVTLKNTGATPLSISNIGVSGPAAGDYADGSTCPSLLAAGASCSIPVSFTPSRKGSRTAYLVVTDNAQGRTQQVPLSGSGN